MEVQDHGAGATKKCLRLKLPREAVGQQGQHVQSVVMQTGRSSPDTKSLMNTVETVLQETDFLLPTLKWEAFGSHRSWAHCVPRSRDWNNFRKGVWFSMKQWAHSQPISLWLPSVHPVALSLKASILQFECHLTLCWHTRVGWVGTSCSVICSSSSLLSTPCVGGRFCSGAGSKPSFPCSSP